MKVNYVCPCWSGWRRGGDDLYNKDRSLYLRVQLLRLLYLNHSLSQITICIPQNDKEPKEFSDFLYKFPDKIKDTPVVIFKTENTISSYGPYNFVFEKYRDKFDAYILIEDDYVFTQHNFDSILTKYLEKDKNVGYWCSRVGICEDNTPTASVSNGIVPAWAFEKIKNKYGCIPYAGQIEFSNAFRDTNIKMKDFGNRYRVPFYGFGSCAWFYHFNNADLIVPVQIFLEQDKYREVFLPSTWPEWYDQILPIKTFTDHAMYEKELKRYA